MAPVKKSDVDVVVEGMREEVGKIRALERNVDELKESVAEIRGRMGVLDRLEQRMNEEEEVRKREFAALFQAKMQANVEEEEERPIQRPGKQIAGGEEQSGLFHAGTTEQRIGSVTASGGVRREEGEYRGQHQSVNTMSRPWMERDDQQDES